MFGLSQIPDDCSRTRLTRFLLSQATAVTGRCAAAIANPNFAGSLTGLNLAFTEMNDDGVKALCGLQRYGAFPYPERVKKRLIAHTRPCEGTVITSAHYRLPVRLEYSHDCLRDTNPGHTRGPTSLTLSCYSEKA